MNLRLRCVLPREWFGTRYTECTREESSKDNPRRPTLGTMLVVNYPYGLGRVEVDYVAAALTESFRVPRAVSQCSVAGALAACRRINLPIWLVIQ
jgi:hypothetical protein